MKTSVSFLKSPTTYQKTIEQICSSQADFIHVDVMDGLFVNQCTNFNQEKMDILKNAKKAKEIHLMTLHLKKFIDVFSYVQPEMIIYEFEATTNHEKMIKYIQEKNCKVGIAISPLTKLEEIHSLLKKVDLVLVMGVIPGYGGQKFIQEMASRVKELYTIRKDKKLNFLISMDGGINDETIIFVRPYLDRVVAGSFICNSANYNQQLDRLKQ